MQDDGQICGVALSRGEGIELTRQMTWIAALFVCECLGFMLGNSNMPVPSLGRALAGGSCTETTMRFVRDPSVGVLGQRTWTRPYDVDVRATTQCGLEKQASMRKEVRYIGIGCQPASWLL